MNISVWIKSESVFRGQATCSGPWCSYLSWFLFLQNAALAGMICAIAYLEHLQHLWFTFFSIFSQKLGWAGSWGSCDVSPAFGTSLNLPSLRPSSTFLLQKPLWCLIPSPSLFTGMYHHLPLLTDFSRPVLSYVVTTSHPWPSYTWNIAVLTEAYCKC